MGVMHVEPGTAKWAGDVFAASAYVPELKLPVAVVATLRATEDHFPKDMLVQYRTRLGVWDYVLRYGYTTNVGLPFLPNRIQSFFVSKGKEQKMMEWNIMEIKSSSTQLNEAMFNLQTAMATNQSRVLYYTNHAWYARNALGELAPITAAGMAWKVSAQRLNNHNYYYGAVILSSLFAFAFMSKAKKETRQ
jgi:hypothetical protein